MKVFLSLLFTFALLAGGTVSAHAQAFVPKLTLTYSDNSTNETGFSIERGPAAAGPFAEIATVAANVVEYVDTAIAVATIYCYRLRGFNERMINSVMQKEYSGYSNVQCGSSVPKLDGSPSDLLLSAQEAIGNAQELLGDAAAKIAQAMQR